MLGDQTPDDTPENEDTHTHTLSSLFLFLAGERWFIKGSQFHLMLFLSGWPFHFQLCTFVRCSLTQGPGQLTAVLEERLHTLASSLPRLMRQHGQFGMLPWQQHDHTHKTCTELSLLNCCNSLIPPMPHPHCPPPISPPTHTYTPHTQMTPIRCQHSSY